jgi:hypothetical protein
MPSNITYTMQDRTPYTYLIGWSKLNLWYYGRRTAKGCNPTDFFVSYFTSSSKVSDIRIKYGNPDVIKIHKTFSDIKSCCLYEEKFLTRVNAAKSEVWLNQTNGNKNFDTTGKKLSESHKQKLSWKGKKHSEETKLKMSKVAIGHKRCLGKKHSEETKLKMSKASKGNKSRTNLPHTAETKLKMSETAKNKPKIICQYCSKSIDPGNYGKYHGSKCKNYQTNLLSIQALL